MSPRRPPAHAAVEAELGEMTAVAVHRWASDVCGELFVGRPAAAMPGCSPATVWVDQDELSFAIDPSSARVGGPDPSGQPTYELIAAVGLIGGRWWWCAFAARIAASFPEETRDDAKLAVDRRMGQVYG